MALLSYLDELRIYLEEGISHLESLIALIVGRVSGLGSSIYLIRLLTSQEMFPGISRSSVEYYLGFVQLPLACSSGKVNSERDIFISYF